MEIPVLSHKWHNIVVGEKALKIIVILELGIRWFHIKVFEGALTSGQARLWPCMASMMISRPAAYLD
jgi:hypothetical protein